MVEQFGIGADQHRRQLTALRQRLRPGFKNRLRLQPQRGDIANRHRRRSGGYRVVDLEVVGCGDLQLGELAVPLGVDR